MRQLLGPDATGAEALRVYWRRHSGRLSDLFYLGFGLIYTVVATFEEFSTEGAARGMFTGTALLVGTASLIWRRQYPLLVVTLLTLIAFVPNGSGLVALGLFALAIRRRDGVLLAFSAVGAAAMGISTAITFGDPIESTVSTIFFVVAAIASGAFVGARRDLVSSLRERAERAESEQHLRADQARLSERSRIAQEMHDVLAHKISLVALHAGGLEVRPDAGPEAVERAAGLIRSTAREALEDLRGVLGVLRADISPDGAPLAPQPRLDDVPALVEESARAGVPVTLETHLPAGAAVPEVTGRTAYRVVQEALTNVHKHAMGTATTVSLSGSPGDVLAVRVRNVRAVGTGLSPLLPGSGMGLLGLGERVRLAGGRFTAGPDGDGFEVCASLPWPA